MRSSPLNVAVLVSGSGRTLQNFVDLSRARELDIRVSVVIGSKPGLLGVKRAADAGIPNFVVDRKACADLATFSREVFALCDEAKAELICLAGWLCLLDVPER